MQVVSYVIGEDEGGQLWVSGFSLFPLKQEAVNEREKTDVTVYYYPLLDYYPSVCQLSLRGISLLDT